MGLRDGLRGGLNPVAELRGLPRAAACRSAIAALDAWADAHPDAEADEFPARHRPPAVGVEKLVDPELDAPARGAETQWRPGVGESLA